MSTAAEKKKAVMAMVEATAAIAGAGADQAEPYQVNKLRKNADLLGVRAELDDFMRNVWGWTVRASKKKRKKKA
jgi:hypothetical protein